MTTLRNRSFPQSGARAGGFTLMEVLIVTIIIGVLATFAINSYQDSVVRTRRGAAQSCLLEQQQFMERFYTTNLRYDATAAGVALVLPPCAAGAEVNNFYNVTLSTLTRTTFTLRAAPIGAQLAKDTRCGTLTVDNTGNKTKTGTGTLDECW